MLVKEAKQWRKLAMQTKPARPPVNDWGAIWAGVFSFIAIWSVFGLLGLAVFASTGNPSTTRANSGVSIGMGIWAIVLSIIAMYVAGRETGRLAAVSSRHDGLIHGMIMFGLSIAATVVIAALLRSIGSVATSAAEANIPNLLNMSAGLSWIEFLSLFLGWLAAMGGAASGTQRRSRLETPVQEIRPAA
jgi:hypothetical protein